MNRTSSVFAATLLCIVCSYLLFGQNSREQMTFFVTSIGMGNGGNLGGLAGADAHCQTLAQAAGGSSNKIWHAYLSTQASGNQPAISARGRIGAGPWQNADGGEVAVNLADLHGDSGQGAPVNRTVALTEKGQLVEGSKHDILTGTQPNGSAYTDGMDHTCNNWTSNGAGSAQLGHHDRAAGGGEFGGGGRGGRRDEGGPSWNSSHPSGGCSQDAIASNGAGLFYCFATN